MCVSVNLNVVLLTPTERWSVSEPGAGLRTWDGLQSGQTLQPSQADPAYGLCQGMFDVFSVTLNLCSCAFFF